MPFKHELSVSICHEEIIMGNETCSMTLKHEFSISVCHGHIIMGI